MGSFGWIKTLPYNCWLVYTRPNVSWMTQADDRILELLAESGIALSPKVIAWNTGYNRNTVSQHLKPLREASLVNRVDEGMYEITDHGRQYLTGELSAEDLED